MATKSKPVDTSICQCLTIDSESDSLIKAGSCGTEIGSKSTFAPGHDARTKGTLQRAYRSDKEISFNGQTGPAKTFAIEYGYERFLTDKPKVERKPSVQPKQVQVGRWTYEVVSSTRTGKDSAHVVYLDKKGNTKEADVKVEQLVK